jgi:hypothetical protein
VQSIQQLKDRQRRTSGATREYRHEQFLYLDATRRAAMDVDLFVAVGEHLLHAGYGRRRLLQRQWRSWLQRRCL